MHLFSDSGGRRRKVSRAKMRLLIRAVSGAKHRAPKCAYFLIRAVSDAKHRAAKCACF
jgi:hypothetical protein